MLWLRCTVCWLGLIITASLLADSHRADDVDDNISRSERLGLVSGELHSGVVRYRAEVKRVIDGDTLELVSGQKLRLIGINTPELETPSGPAEEGGEQAKTWLQNSLHNRRLWLELDQQQTDHYGRLLAHAFLETGTYLNAALLEAGLASVTLIPPNLGYLERLLAAQEKAEQSGTGIWGLPAYQPKLLDRLNIGQTYRGWQRWQFRLQTISIGARYVSMRAADHFVLRIPRENLTLFPELDSYLGKKLEVRGWMKRRGSEYSMLVLHPSALKVL